jgi:hypothetical protein
MTSIRSIWLCLFLAFAWAQTNTTNETREDFCLVLPDLANLKLFPFPKNEEPGSFVLNANTLNYMPNETINVTIEGNFIGIMIYALNEANNTKFGAWDLSNLNEFEIPSTDMCGDRVASILRNITGLLGNVTGNVTQNNTVPPLTLTWVPDEMDVVLPEPIFTMEDDGFTVDLPMNGTGRVCFVALDRGSDMPSADQVLNGLTANGTNLTEGRFGCVNLPDQLTATGLSQNMTLDVYFVAELQYPELKFVWYIIDGVFPFNIYRGWVDDDNVLTINSNATFKTEVLEAPVNMSNQTGGNVSSPISSPISSSTGMSNTSSPGGPDSSTGDDGGAASHTEPAALFVVALTLLLSQVV